MVLKTTRWKPDTCRCEIEYEWDTEESPNTRAHNLKRLLKKCPDHAGVVESKVLATITVENSMKNHILKEILDNNESLREQAYNGSGQPSGFNLKTDLNYEWNFEGKDEERTLKVSIMGRALTAQEKIGVQQAIATKSSGRGQFVDR